MLHKRTLRHGLSYSLMTTLDFIKSKVVIKLQLIRSAASKIVKTMMNAYTRDAQRIENPFLQTFPIHFRSLFSRTKSNLHFSSFRRPCRTRRNRNLRTKSPNAQRRMPRLPEPEDQDPTTLQRGSVTVGEIQQLLSRPFDTLVKRPIIHFHIATGQKRRNEKYSRYRFASDHRGDTVPGSEDTGRAFGGRFGCLMNSEFSLTPVLVLLWLDCNKHVCWFWILARKEILVFLRVLFLALFFSIMSVIRTFAYTRKL